MINKQKNTNLQITISKEANAKLTAIMEEINQGQIIGLNKSQTIEFLIMRFSLKSDFKKEREEAKETARSEYSNRLKKLQKKTKLSITKLAEKLGISYNTFKKYVYGYHEPTENNKIIIDEALKEYKLWSETKKTVKTTI